MVIGPSDIVSNDGLSASSNNKTDDWLTAVGYASISEQRPWCWRKAAYSNASFKIDAYRELAEQVYGMRVSGRAELNDQRLGTEHTTGGLMVLSVVLKWFAAIKLATAM